MTSDRVFGLVGLALAGFYVWQATQIELGFSSDPLGPRSFPIIIGGVMALASVYPLVRPDPRPDWPAAGRLLEIALAVAVLVAYALALPQVGFVLATAVAAAILSWRLGSRPLGAVLAGIGISVGIYVVFHLILGLSLARGPWGF
ncbi:tripartite tricarboxylate transporter TctB family protein [Caenispirillum bisanense]|uniref:Putative tricarboxylic transport membrane protein n=1 Tax=Caenispirillum bisanense TaxID=414052 RepID=A0A286GVZ8_9PROT|nr:tripartite tricarboxylate transporter TctB family protein [Caenispirillum bisanense]SOD99651.1 putative tricarboxylic transport membrane protein [Caenispirillum bisanense]